ncbi:hypothetical protein NX722_11140 [Endozoicomonas gorgoniicola]|uniref:Uncharacterized protein n=1 Tax=Endozoicomonas gorgoniicola TaxID=1234144 RepID=A0ABT3MUX9_9GAMM|nr:hypothetical protein [Endozoicomonas gorgoniicola]MCW7553182.1 hypothetical protein [Endozoicomonas gorgoniicola]
MDTIQVIVLPFLRLDVIFEVIMWGELVSGALSGISAMLCIHFFLGMISRMGLMPGYSSAFDLQRQVAGVVLSMP